MGICIQQTLVFALTGVLVGNPLQNRLGKTETISHHLTLNVVEQPNRPTLPPKFVTCDALYFAIVYPDKTARSEDHPPISRKKGHQRGGGSLVTAIFGRLWPHQLLRCRQLFVAGAIFGHVGVSLLVASALFGDVGGSIFVAGAAFGEIWLVQSSTGVGLCSMYWSSTL